MTTSMVHSLFKRISVIALIAFLTAPLSAWAIDLGAAKDQGLVGEQTNGYLGSVTQQPSSEIQKLVTEINQKRKAAYQQKAKEAGVSLTVMEQNVAKRLIERAEKGHYVSNGQGDWQKK